MSHLGRFCLLAEMVLHLLGLQQGKLKAESAAMVAVLDFEPPTWLSLWADRCWEPLSARHTAGPWAHSPCPQRAQHWECESSAAWEAQKISSLLIACTLLFQLSLWGNSHRALPKDVVEGISRSVWVFCPNDIYMSFLILGFSSQWISSVRRCHWFWFSLHSFLTA